MANRSARGAHSRTLRPRRTLWRHERRRGRNGRLDRRVPSKSSSRGGRLEPADRFVDKRGALALEVEEKPFYPIPSGDLQERETITNPERSLDRAWDGVASEETADLVMRWLSGLERIVGKERQLRVLGRRDTPSLFRFVHLFVPAVQRFNNPRSLAAFGAEGAKLI